MGKQIAVENKTSSLMFIGDKIVAPGDCQHFDEDLVPHHLRPKDPETDGALDELQPPPEDPVAERFGVKPDELLAKIAEITETAPDNDVQALGLARVSVAELLEIEGESEKSRPDVLAALAKLQLVIGEKLVIAEAKAKAAAEAAEMEARSKQQEEEAQAEAERRKRVDEAEAWAHKVRGMNRAELAAHLKAKHVKFETDANKDRLIELCIEHP